MTQTFTLQIDRAEGSLQRLIGLIERRGFHIDRMSVADAGQQREVRLTVRARDEARCVDVLGRQIDRLVGVSRERSVSEPYQEGAVVCTA